MTLPSDQHLCLTRDSLSTDFAINILCAFLVYNACYVFHPSWMLPALMYVLATTTKHIIVCSDVRLWRSPPPAGVGNFLLQPNRPERHWDPLYHLTSG